MTEARAADAKSLINAVRNRLWLQRSVDVVSANLRICGGIAFAAGLYHAFIHTAPTVFVVIMTLIPIIGALSAAMVRRPDLATAARTADVWFDGKNLMTSAWDLFQRNGRHSSMEELVMARARALAPQWRKRMASLKPIRCTYPVTTPVILILCGIFLLQLPSKEWLTRIQDRANGRAVHQGRHPVYASGEFASPISESAPAPESFGNAPTSSPIFAPEFPADTNVDPSLPLTSQSAHLASELGVARRDAGSFTDGTANHPSSTTNEGGQSAGDPGITGENKASGMEPAKLKVKEIGIQLRANGQGTDGRGNELQEAVTGTQGSTVTAAVPPAQHAQAAVRGIYTPALRAYISRYMQELDTQRVQRP